MKHINLTFLLTVLMSMVGANVFAYDIAVQNADGKTIYYNFINNNTELAVTYQNYYTNSYSGNIVIPESVTYNGTTYSVTSIGYSAFRDCPELTSVTIGNSVTSIEKEAFMYCFGLQSVTIGTRVQTIGSDIFDGDYKPSKVIWLPNTPPSGYKNAAGRLNFVANNLYTSMVSIIYPFLSSIFEVGGIKYVPVTPSEHTCDAIDCNYSQEAENINLGETVTYNGIQMEVERVCNYVCYGNPFIKNLSISFKGDIRLMAFRDCINLMTAFINNSGRIGEESFSGCTALSTVELGDGVTEIEEAAFGWCSQLSGIVIPNSVKKIRESAFEGCSAMTFVKMGTGIASIASYSFKGCTSLNDIQIGSSVKTIDTGAFSGCKALTQIQIPRSVLSISDYAFTGCSALKNVIMDEQETELKLGSNGSNPLFKDCPLESVYIGRNISYNTSSSKGYSPFYRNATLQSVEITNKETEISDNEFYGCSSLKNVKIGDGVTTIGDWAFSGCSSIDYFSFGSSVRVIGKEAFSDCTAITKLISHAIVPPTCGSQALDDINKWNCILSVPQGYTSTYQQAEQWKDFFFINDDVIVTKYKLTYVVDNEEYKCYELVYNAVITPEPAPEKEGYTFSGWSEIPETMPDHDVTVTGSFSLNKYKLTYMVDGVEYKSYDVDFGAAISPEPVPTKVGYTFSGWGTIPETMPAHDVTISGTFSVNKYKLTYFVDGVEYKSYDVGYGDVITPEPAPTKEGYTFSGWSVIPQTMPAHDVTVTGTFTIDTGIEQIMSELNNGAVIYTLDGKRVSDPQKGMNIVRMNNGRTRKVVVK